MQSQVPQRRFIPFLVILLLTTVSVMGVGITMGSYLAQGQFQPTTTPVVPHIDGVGLFHAGTFTLTNTLGTTSADIVVKLGTSHTLPVVGDWNGDSIDTVGIYDPSASHFSLQDTNKTGAPAVYHFRFGPVGGIPISGDWDGDGRDSVGVYAKGVFYLTNSLTSPHVSFRMAFGKPGDIPVAGDWSGQRHDSVGVYRPTTGTFYLTNKLCNCAAPTSYTISFGPTKSMPLTGAWTDAKRSGLGVLNTTTGQLYLKNDATHTGSADRTIHMKATGAIPVAGRWTAATSYAFPRSQHVLE